MGLVMILWSTSTNTFQGFWNLLEVKLRCNYTSSRDNEASIVRNCVKWVKYLVHQLWKEGAHNTYAKALKLIKIQESRKKCWQFRAKTRIFLL